MKILKSKRNIFGLIAVLFLIEIFVLLPNKGMAPAWSTAYFSGAVEYSVKGNWVYDANQTDIFKALNGYDIYFYSFDSPGKKIIENNYNSMGYLYLVLFAKIVFPFLGPIGAIVLLQLLVHILISYLLINKLEKIQSKVLFTLFYFLNPLVLYFTIYPFYYFWQVIPSFIIIYVLYEKSLKLLPILLFIAFLTFSVIIRQTTILLALFGFFLLIGRLSFKWKIIGIVLPILIFGFYNVYFNKTKGMSPWHTIYIGIGAYPNSIMQGLSDNNGYDRFNTLTSETVDASLNGNIQNDYNFRERYFQTIKFEYLKVLQNNPLLIVRNAILNFFASFSFGFHPKIPFLIQTCISMFGLIIIILYIKCKMFMQIIVISLSHITFSLYYPPIFAYVFGTIILNVFFIIELINRRKKLLFDKQG
jgi:hypothetical protein